MRVADLAHSPVLPPSLAALNFVRAVQRCSGTAECDPPDPSDNRLSFRLKYQKGIAEGWARWADTGDWSAYVIAPTEDGTLEVLFTQLPERSGTRSETCRAVFTDLADATKFVMVSVLDSVRTNFELESLFVTYRSRGLDERLTKGPATPTEAAPLISRLPPDRAHLAKRVQRVVHQSDSSRAAVGFLGVEPYFNVLTLSLGDVARALVAGLPTEVGDCVERYVGEHGG